MITVGPSDRESARQKRLQSSTYRKLEKEREATVIALEMVEE